MLVPSTWPCLAPRPAAFQLHPNPTFPQNPLKAHALPLSGELPKVPGALGSQSRLVRLRGWSWWKAEVQKGKVVLFSPGRRCTPNTGYLPGSGGHSCELGPCSQRPLHDLHLLNECGLGDDKEEKPSTVRGCHEATGGREGNTQHVEASEELRSHLNILPSCVKGLLPFQALSAQPCLHPPYQSLAPWPFSSWEPGEGSSFLLLALPEGCMWLMTTCKARSLVARLV